MQGLGVTLSRVSITHEHHPSPMSRAVTYLMTECGASLIAAGVKPEMVEKLCANEVVKVGDKSGPAFDVFEEVDSSTVLKDILELQR